MLLLAAQVRTQMVQTLYKVYHAKGTAMHYALIYKTFHKPKILRRRCQQVFNMNKEEWKGGNFAGNKAEIITLGYSSYATLLYKYN